MSSKVNAPEGRVLRDKDFNWFANLFYDNEQELLSDPFDAWQVYIDNPECFIIGLPSAAFLRYTKLASGWTEINEIVSIAKGCGSYLLKQVPLPIIVATRSAGNFYSSNGFVSFGYVVKNNVQLEVYIKEQRPLFSVFSDDSYCKLSHT